MALVFREEKGAPLTIKEIDGNFRHLQKSVGDIAKAPPYVESVGKVEQEGDVLRVIGTLGTNLGEVRLPKFRPQVNGEWVVNKNYLIGDWMRREGHLYQCLKTHKSKTFEADMAHWELVL